MYRVNEQTCIGCEVCVQTCPGGMMMGYDGIAEVIDQNELERCGGESICPSGAIVRMEGESKPEGAQPLPRYPSPAAFRARSGLGQGMVRGGGQGRAGGRGGMGGRRAAGPSGTCICPNCGNKEIHQAGQPCYQRQCPACGARMRRE